MNVKTSFHCIGDYEEAANHHEIEWQLALHEENDQARCQARVNLGAALRHTPEKYDEVGC